MTSNRLWLALFFVSASVTSIDHSAAHVALIVPGALLLALALFFLHFRTETGDNQRDSRWQQALLGLMAMATGIFHLIVGGSLLVSAYALSKTRITNSANARGMARALSTLGVAAIVAVFLRDLYLQCSGYLYAGLAAQRVFDLISLVHSNLLSAHGTLISSVGGEYSVISFSPEVLLPNVAFVFMGLTLLFLVLVVRMRVKSLVVFVTASLLYLLIRYALLIFAFVETGDLAFLYDPFGPFFTILPLALLLSAALGALGVRTPLVGRDSSALPYIVRVASLALIGLGIAGFLYIRDDRGAPKAGRVLIDEYYSSWSWSDAAPADLGQGFDADYNYAYLTHHLSKLWDVTKNVHPIDSVDLRSFDVLILKMPTRLLTDHEVASVLDFVENGGGLLMIGDHTDVFGSSTALQRIAVHVGCRFTFTAISSSDGEPALLCTGGPVTGSLLSEPERPFYFTTSCAIETTLPFRNDMVLRNVFVRQGDYSRPYFFPEVFSGPSDVKGSATVCCSRRLGLGRIVALGESTVFSNLTFFNPGIRDLFVDIVGWLNRRDRVRHLEILWLIVLLAGLAGVGVTRTARTSLLTECGLILILGFLLGKHAVIGMATGRPVVQDGVESSIWFIEECSAFRLDPSYRFFHDRSAAPDEHCYQTLNTQCYRRDLRPRTCASIDGVPDSALAVVVVGSEDGRASCLSSVANWVRAGGRLLVLLASDVSAGSLDSAFGELGLRAEALEDGGRPPVSGAYALWNISDSSASTPWPCCRLTDSQPWVVNPDGVTAIWHARIGNGQAIVCCVRGMFNDAQLGMITHKPNQEELKRLALLHLVLDRLKGEPPLR